MTGRFVCALDASALLAVLNRAVGADRVAPLLDGAAMSAINWSETLQKAALYGIEVTDLHVDVEGLGVTIVPYTVADAEQTAWLWRRTRAAGLSLGERACLALALREDIPAVTTVRSWATLTLAIRVNVIR